MTEHVEVTGRGASHVVPDLVIVRARLQSDAKDVASALTESSNRTAAALQAASDHGIEARDRRTDDVGIHPRHDQNGRKVIGYTAYQAFRLTVRDRDRVGDLLQALAGAAGDALAVDGIEMAADQTEAAVSAARDAAFEDARTRATQFAHLAGTELGKVIRIREGRVDDQMPRPMFARSADFAGSMPIEGGTQAISTTVTVRWELA
ncbi:outer membrane protein, 28Kda [Janibacter sp. HTCC2649]|uniref:SIMPL domain-containing protein n=1 Tax=Janibacter sp. HTCC2649 TaxID=313589 RepID=UPI00006708CF|nr:SIMPL domain-containing protein [Janibacter sp. HTCC2649]EAP99801.1 outer membrane protein, 28Kda [Janibacter sp. HTCC2649]